MTGKTLRPETLALHGGYRADPATNSVTVPIYQTTAYTFDSAEHASNLFALKELGNIYTRLMNPTQDVLEKRVALIEGGVAGLALSSGQSANMFALLNIAQAGDNIVSSTDLYGGTHTLFAHTLRKMGVEVRFVDQNDPENFARATDDKTRAYFGETLPNPKLQAFPIAEVAEVGTRFNIPLVVDNTAAPLLCRPLDHGAAIVTHSTTKYIGGHGSAMGGIVVDGGNFDWEATPERFPLLNEPDPTYHGAIWTQAVKPLGPIAYILKMRVTLLRDIGASATPFNSFQHIQGLETLALRMDAHSRNAEKVADYLAKHDKVSKVIYPTQQTGVHRERAEKYFSGGYGGLMGFEVKGGREAGQKFIDALELFYHVTNLGDVRSLASHPSSTTHSQLSAEEQLACGVSEGYIRLSIGIEHIDDIIADIDQALEKA